MNGVGVELRRIGGTLLAAAVIGSWAYLTTRSSHADVESVRTETRMELRRVETESRRRDESVLGKLHEIEVEQSAEIARNASFRREVREALRIGPGND